MVNSENINLENINISKLSFKSKRNITDMLNKDFLKEIQEKI